MKKESLTVKQKIIKHLEDNGQKMSWLCNKIGVTQGHLHAVLKGEGKIERDLTKNNLDKINSVLGTDF